MTETNLEEWHFDFGLGNQDGKKLIAQSECDELVDVIIDWAERRGYGIGGGFRPFEQTD